MVSFIKSKMREDLLVTSRLVVMCCLTYAFAEELVSSMVAGNEHKVIILSVMALEETLASVLSGI